MPESLAEDLNEEQCFGLLGQVPVGRVGITVGSLPVILPVNYAFVDGCVAFRTNPGTKLRAATANTVVAFEVDSYAPDGSSGWSVLIQGIASTVTDREEAHRLLAALGIPHDSADFAGGLVKIKAEKCSGRRFGPAEN
jgi:nitroimidazol reductase NimA-like FMN-containing flavoprotein (pyridoxamine 5'-phosphate oxidase superfamily)